MNQFFNRESETDKRRLLRGSMPEAEVILWSRLKGRQLLGCKFRRQYSENLDGVLETIGRVVLERRERGKTV